MSNNKGRMKLYTSTGTRKTIEECNKLNIGLLMVDTWRNPDEWPYFAIDNGCFAAYHREEDWSPAPFLRILSRVREEKRMPEFIVVPDIPLSPNSLTFSKAWLPLLKLMYPDFPRYLAVQDGMEPIQIIGMVPDLAGIFIGGSIDWKMETLPTWVKFAHEHGLDCHVGRIGPTKRMMICELAGADSIDSTTWVQNKGGINHYVGGFNSQTRIEDHSEDVLE